MNASEKKYRLLTRSDMDGLVCAVLLKEMGILGEIVFHHPKDVQDGKVAVTEQRHSHELAVRAWLRPLLRPSRQRRRAQQRPTYTELRSQTRRKVGSARGVRLLRRQGALPACQRRHDGRRGQGRQRRLQSPRRAEPQGLGTAELPDGCAHRPGPFPRVPGFQLPVDDDARSTAAETSASRRSWPSPT